MMVLIHTTLRIASVKVLGLIGLVLLAAGVSAAATASSSDVSPESPSVASASATGLTDLPISIQRVAPAGSVGEGQSPAVEYLIEVLNDGPADRFGLELQVHIDDGLIAPTWGCAVPDAACDPSLGDGDVLAHFDLPIGVRASVNLYAQVNPNARYVEIDVRALQPGAQTPLQNTAQLVDPIRTGSLFRGGFESYAQ